MYVGPRRVHNTEANADGLVPPPGKLKEWLKAMKEGKSNVEGWIQPTADMWDRDARLRSSTSSVSRARSSSRAGSSRPIGLLPITDRTGNAVLHAYNRYLHDHWGFNVQDRIYPTPLLSLWDLESSVAGNRVGDQARRARIVVMPMGPADDKSPAHPYFDPVWARLNEAGVAVAYHVSEANFMHPLIERSARSRLQSRRTGQTAWQWMFCYSEIPVQMTLANIVYHNFFERFPNIRIVSAENGANWLPGFLEKMDKMRGMARNGYWPCGQLKERPSRIFRRHCYVVAYPEDDVEGHRRANRRRRMPADGIRLSPRGRRADAKRLLHGGVDDAVRRGRPRDHARQRPTAAAAGALILKDTKRRSVARTSAKAATPPLRRAPGAESLRGPDRPSFP